MADQIEDAATAGFAACPLYRQPKFARYSRSIGEEFECCEDELFANPPATPSVHRERDEDGTVMEERLLNLLHKVRDEGDVLARTELNELLRNVSEARAIVARTLVDEQALMSCLRDESIVSILNGEEKVTARPSTSCPVRLLSWQKQIAVALTSGAIVGLLGFGVVWAMNSPRIRFPRTSLVNSQHFTIWNKAGQRLRMSQPNGNSKMFLFRIQRG
ncbi:MAG: hypothetical protein AAF483_04165 [Planctomycetota bacterium]